MFKRACKEYSPSVTHKSTSASTAVSAGSLTPSLEAAIPNAPIKQADQPAANNCSGFVPGRDYPGELSLIFNCSSEL